MDGCHKLVKFGIVVHGIIDGFSRLLVALVGSDNNTSETVLRMFKTAVHEVNGTPRFLRTDKGGENVKAAEYMLEYRGPRTVLTGRSVHNQRIERLWRDSTTDVLPELLPVLRL